MCLAISHEMQPGTDRTGPAGILNRPQPAEQQGGRSGCIKSWWVRGHPTSQGVLLM